MLTNWLELARRAVTALERIADALEARAMLDGRPRAAAIEDMEVKANGTRVG